jgi:hypothetical protein
MGASTAASTSTAASARDAHLEVVGAGIALIAGDGTPAATPDATPTAPTDRRACATLLVLLALVFVVLTLVVNAHPSAQPPRACRLVDVQVSVELPIVSKPAQPHRAADR